jgi:uncharacterized membrane protein YbhN (UPF0104 family)
MRPIYKRILRAVIVVLSLGFLAIAVRSQWVALSNYQWHLAPGWALLALIGLELTWLFELATWRTILWSLGGPLPFWRSAQIWFLSNLMRYIPGNIWQFLGMAEMAAQDGVPRLATLTSIVLHQVISTAAGIVLAAVYFASAGQGEWLGRIRPLLLLAPLGLFLLQPALLERILNWAMAKLGRPPLKVTLTWGQVWVLLLRYVLVWLGMGLSFAAMTRALTPAGWTMVPALMAAWTAAYIIGYLSMLTPSGLGVREGAMVLLLAPVFPLSVAAVVAIVARLWMVLGELVGAGIALAARPAWREVQRLARNRRSLDRQT